MEIKIKKSEKKVPKIERIQYNDSMALGKASRRKDRKSPGGASNKKKCKEENRDARPKLKKGDYEKCLNGNCLSERCHSY